MAGDGKAVGLHGRSLGPFVYRGPMRIATWNVNSVRSRLDQLTAWLAAEQPEVVCLQETKVTDDLFPHDALARLGYSCVVSGQKSYNGVAILSRLPLEDVRVGFDAVLTDDPEAAALSEQKRVISARVEGLRILDLRRIVQRARPRLAAAVDHRIGGNPHEPALQGACLAHLGRILPQLDEGLLGHVLGIRRAVGHPPCQPVDRLVVAAGNLGEGRVGARGGGLEQAGIRHLPEGRGVACQVLVPGSRSVG